MKALITGGSSGIGRDMARILAKLNYNLILVARNEDGLTKIKNELETENNKINITIYPMDLNIKENCYKLYENEKNIDVLINNAGFGLFGEFAETDLEKEITMINTNITAVQILTKLYLKDMIKKDLRLQTGLSTSTMSKLSKDENVSMDIIEKICTVLNCDVGDIMEFVPDKKEEQ